MDDLAGIGKAIEPLTAAAADLSKRLLGPTVDEAGLAGAAIARRCRKSIEQLLEKTQRAIDKRGKTASAVHTRLLVPILQSASREDDDWMLERWADLLASAATDEEVHPSFAAILAELLPAEARQLQEETRHLGIDDPIRKAWVKRREFILGRDVDQLYLNNWVRLGLVETLWDAELGVNTGGRTGLGVTSNCQYRITVLGEQFLRACGAFESDEPDR